MNAPLAEPTAVLETRFVHQVHRRATALLADAAPNPSVPGWALQELRDFLVPFLEHHHESEDHVLWPLLVTAAPHLTVALDDLTTDHVRLDETLHAVAKAPVDGDRRALTEAARTLRDLIHDHLAQEERLLLPALRAHLSEPAWAAFSQHTVTTAPTDGIHVFVALVHQVSSPEELAAFVAALPEPARPQIPMLREAGDRTLGALTAALS
jgi:hemerythrin-like domain-containing protein